jgi:hypothetical protein
MSWKRPKGRPFVKGQRPKHWRPVGSERKTDRGIEVKINEPDKWRLKHLAVWEAANGPLPKGFRLAFRDGDRCNCSLDNLVLEQSFQKLGGDGFIYVKKLDSRKWWLKHVVVWEEANGPLPKGQALIFADGNRHNCDLDNLILVPRDFDNPDGMKFLARAMELAANRDACYALNATITARLAKNFGVTIKDHQEKI